MGLRNILISMIMFFSCNPLGIHSNNESNSITCEKCFQSFLVGKNIEFRSAPYNKSRVVKHVDGKDNPVKILLKSLLAERNKSDGKGYCWFYIETVKRERGWVFGEHLNAIAKNEVDIGYFYVGLSENERSRLIPKFNNYLVGDFADNLSGDKFYIDSNKNVVYHTNNKKQTGKLELIFRKNDYSIVPVVNVVFDNGERKNLDTYFEKQSDYIRFFYFKNNREMKEWEENMDRMRPK